MSENSKKIPNQAEVRQIFNDTYNVFYKKWKDVSNPDDWVQLMQEMRQLDKKYNCGLCRQILLELVKCIENEFKLRRDSSE